MSEPIQVIGCPNPFSIERIEAAIEPGATLADILADVQPDPILLRHAHVFIGDWYIPREHWSRVRPKPGQTITFRIVPTGGGDGGKNPLRTVLQIAVIAAAAWVSGGGLAGIAGSALQSGTLASTVATAGTAVAGPVMVNAATPPGRP